MISESATTHIEISSLTLSRETFFAYIYKMLEYNQYQESSSSSSS